MQNSHHHTNGLNGKQAEPAPDPVRPGSASLAEMNAKLAGKKGKIFWKSFEELSGTPEFEAWVGEEFPSRAGLLQVDRRRFLTLGGAALGLAGLTGCRLLPQTKAVPYVRNPEDMIPGKAMMYTSTLVRAGYGIGVTVESHEGRPTKIEGNKNHPASLGATDLWMQAEILGMYDPERSQNVKTNDETSDWSTFLGVAAGALKASAGGNGVAFLSETISSPTLASQRKALLAKYPSIKWYEYEPATRDNIYNGTKLVFGSPVSPVYHLDKAKIIVSLDSDFLLTDGNNSNVRLARDFSTGRKVRYAPGQTATMSRLYSFESGYTVTGASSDHRFPVRPSQVEGIARALFAAVSGGSAATAPDGVDAKVFDAVVKDLAANKGSIVIVPGDGQSPVVHALAHAINATAGGLGGADATVTYIAPLEADPGNQVAGLKTLTDSLNAGSVKALFILGGNPVYNAPAELQFDKAMVKASMRAHLSRYEDETSSLSTWHLPESHFLEAWGDARSFEGTASVIQPLIAPLYDTQSASELMSHLVDEPQPGYDIVHDYWMEKHGAGADSVAWWEKVLVTGTIPGTIAPNVTVAPVGGLEAALPAPAAPSATSADSLEISLRPDPTIYDGRYANNSWLQETPKPVTTITWDNSAQISPRTAVKLGIISDAVGESDATHIGDANGKKLLTLSVNGGKTTLPVWILPGLPEGTVTVHLGYGRTICGNVGNDMGANAYPLRSSATIAGGSTVVKVAIAPGEYQIAATQAYHSLKGINEDENREIVLASTLDEFVKKQGKIFEKDDVTYVIPESRAFPDQPKEMNAPTPDGSLAQDINMEGSVQANAPTVPADYFRKEWDYTSVSQSNDKGWPTVYPEYSNKGFNAWAMGIDLTSCIGCNSCSVACQAENNVPTVGKDQVGRGRHMHWLRIDHYYAGESLDDVESYFQPLACVQCEKAPCEPVCPVAATIHSHEGINQMVYNRCIGTRYCSNNCPYKVRRFNFLKWTAGIGGPGTVNYDLPVLRMLSNPEVTVRGRGVMEKCNYCIQRINEVRIESKKNEQEIRDGDVVTACQQACPTQAIAFGDINDPNSVVSQWRRQHHDYSLLSDLNTRPRTTYLAKIRNANPDLTPAAASSEKTG